MSRGGKWFAGLEIDDILSVSSLESIGPIAWQRLYNSFESLKKVLNARRDQLIKAGLSELQAKLIIERPRHQEVQRRLLDSQGIKVVTIDDTHYPKLLSQISDPPLWLYYKGNLSALKRPCLTVVGSRKPTSYARMAIETLLPETLSRQICIVSGLAYGIDKMAHERALRSGGCTVAVLAGGLDTIYPSDHYRLAKSIIDAGGALLSEYPPRSKPRPYRFPIRNRILAGLSAATVIIQATLKSGTLTTAKSSLDYNREIFAVPGDIGRSQSEGSNFLLQHGATPLIEAKQLFDYFKLKNSVAGRKIDNELSGVINLLADKPLTVDSLAAALHQPIEKVLGYLTRLELEDLIYQPQVGHYLAKKLKGGK